MVIDEGSDEKERAEEKPNPEITRFKIVAELTHTERVLNAVGQLIHPDVKHDRKGRRAENQHDDIGHQRRAVA